MKNQTIHNHRFPVEQDMDRWIRELTEAGWKPHPRFMFVWVAPNGSLYRGPYGAWRVMRAAKITELEKT